MIVVSPNNPTGTVLSTADVRALSACCATHGLALIADEVFVDYRLPAASGHPSTVLTDATCLTVSLGGLSKAVGLPQLKLAWMAVAGPDARGARPARSPRAGRRLVPVGRDADPGRAAGDPRAEAPSCAIRSARVRRQPCRAAASPRGVAGHPTARARRRLDGGAARARDRQRGERSPSICSERHHVVVQPGYFYDFPTEAWLVVSLLVEPGVVRARHRTDRRCDRHGI